MKDEQDQEDEDREKRENGFPGRGRHMCKVIEEQGNIAIYKPCSSHHGSTVSDEAEANYGAQIIKGLVFLVKEYGLDLEGKGSR